MNIAKISRSERQVNKGGHLSIPFYRRQAAAPFEEWHYFVDMLLKRKKGCRQA
jgi:hypothetical protein